MSQLSHYDHDDCGDSSSYSSTCSVDSDHGINDSICGNGSINKSDNLLERTVLHLDVDCFYCQCHEIERPELQSIPFAVGQKHIIVTCNYPARAVGVSKLMLKTEAIKKCPTLIILDGSDLEPYRLAGRRVYDAFREGIILHFGTYLKQKETNTNVRNSSLQVKKGGMDEMYADVTAPVDAAIGHATNTAMKNASCFNASHNEGETLPSFQPFVYCDNSTERIVITEDQSGASSEATNLSSTSFRLEGRVRSQSHKSEEIWGDAEQREECARRLLAASSIGELVRQYVKERTGFRACIGVSVSSMLAKIASDLKKPDSLNVLFPWHSSGIILPMPLRRIPDLGYGTLKALSPCLEEHNQDRSIHKGKFWTCRDLLKVPRHAVVSCLMTLKSFDEEASERQGTLLLQKCQGIDHTEIIDDDGGLYKTVSVEDSFRRGSVTTRECLWEKVDELFDRLPRLLDERRASSKDQWHNAYPTTIRLTIRVVDESLKLSKTRRRPFITTSKQSPFQGKTLLSMASTKQRNALLQTAVEPLLNQLLLDVGKSLDVTRVNLATTNFMDLLHNSGGSSPPHKCKGQMIVSSYFSTTKTESHSQIGRHTFLTGKAPIIDRKENMIKFDAVPTIIQDKSKKRSHPLSDGAHTMLSSPVPHKQQRNSHILSTTADMDPDVLAELPPDIVKELMQHFESKQTKKSPHGSQNKGIASFFQRKSPN